MDAGFLRKLVRPLVVTALVVGSVIFAWRLDLHAHSRYSRAPIRGGSCLRC